MNKSDILQNILGIVYAGTDPFRVELNKRKHVADLSYGALRASANRLSEKQYESLMDLFEDKYGLRQDSIESAVLYLINTPRAISIFWRNKSTKEAALISGSYRTLQDNISSILKNTGKSSKFKAPMLSKFTSIDEKTGATTTNIGHISSQHEAFTSPLEEQIISLIGNLFTILPSNSPIIDRLNRELNRLRSVHKAEATYELNRYNELTNPKLASLVIVVTVQSAKLNNSYSNKEGAISRSIANYLTSAKVISSIMRSKDSNTILEDIKERVEVSLGGKLTQGSKHTKKPITKKTIDMAPGTNRAVSFQGIPSLKDPTSGKFIQRNLTNLTSLLNFHLHDIVAANMGEGNRKDILNYRTGRFATSTKVERVTQSRDGMISAFYTYMKNPYGTFSTDGKQQFPRTRDPKLLISKSIREIGTKLGIERMRAVLA